MFNLWLVLNSKVERIRGVFLRCKKRLSSLKKILIAGKILMPERYGLKNEMIKKRETGKIEIPSFR
jgi:hypothetical protein